MEIDLTDITVKEMEEMQVFLGQELGRRDSNDFNAFYDFHPLKVRESEFGDTIKARNVVYQVELCSGEKIYAVDGGFLIDPQTRRLSRNGQPQQFKAVYPYIPNEDLADKVHLYLVAKICENERAIPHGGADQLATILGIDSKYKLVNISPKLITLENVNE